METPPKDYVLNGKPWHSKRTGWGFGLGRFSLTAAYNHSNGHMGRCGGGWAYKFGVMGSPSEVCIELTWFTLRLSWRK